LKRWTLLLAGAALWLFLAAIPALADGGPHVAAVNNGSSSLTADSCAGCHRAHTAQGATLLKTDEETLCLTCHGAQSAGATTDVITGVQYVSGAQHNVAASAGTQLGALRNGGFEQARIGDPFRYTIDNGSGVATRKPKIQVSATPEDVTSSHLPALAGLSQPGLAWGNGANGSGVGPVVALECGSCHNPHGNGNFRILRSFGTTEGGIPTGVNAAWTASLFDAGVVNATTFRTVASNGLNVGDTVTISGNSQATANVTGVVASVPASNTFTLTGVTITGTGTGGTVTRSAALGVKVTDSNVDSDNDPTNGIDLATKNYTVIQAPGPGYLLYAAQVTTGPLTGDYLHRVVPWNALTGTNADAPNGIPAAVGTQPAFNDQINAWCSTCHTRYLANQNPTNTSGAVANSWGTPRAAGAVIGVTDVTAGAVFTAPSHGFVVGDKVYLNQTNATPNIGVPAETYTVATVPTTSTFTLTDVTSATAASGLTNTFVRKVDATYMYQHRVRSDRACTTCHVTHGSNAVMEDTNPTLAGNQGYSSTYTYPNGTASASSRLLKVGNRGTCQMCHDPTGTDVIGNQYPPGPVPSTP
jgi:predicted CXXCH cytochrome family protein